MATYSDVHRAFLQAVHNRGTLSIKQAVNILQQIIRKHGSDETIPTSMIPTEDDVREAVQQINDKLKVVDQCLKFVHFEIDNGHLESLVFVNQIETAVLKVQGSYSESECNYFKNLMHAVVEAEGFCASSMTALDIPVSSNMKKISKQRIQDLIDEWVIGGYFVEMNDKIQLGPRAIGEFGDYLIAKFGNRILLCFLCSQPTFKGAQCENCHADLHKICLKKYVERMKKCPKCKTTWNESK